MENNLIEDTQDILIKETEPKHINYTFLISVILQLLFTVIFGVLIYIGLFIFVNGQEDKYFNFFMSPIIEIFAILAPVLIYYLVTKINMKADLKLNKLRIIQIPLLIIIGISAQYVGGFLNYLFIMFLQLFGKVPASEVPKPTNITEIILTTIAIAILPAICEEIFCRGFIMSGYKKYGPKVAIVVSAAFFGIMHLDITNIVFPVFLGLILGYVVYRTNSIFSSMIIHFVNNGLALILLIVGKEEVAPYYETISREDFISYAIIAAIGAAVLFGFLYLVYRTTRNINLISKDNVQVKNFSTRIVLHWPLIIIYIITIGFYVSSIKQIIS